MTTNVLAWLESTAERTPDSVAFSGPEERLTFRALMARAAAAGTFLHPLAPPRRAVAVLMDKSCDAIAACLGAVYAGGFYAYIDRTQPAQRVQAILAQLRPAAIVTSGKLKPQAEALEAGCPVLTTEELFGGAADWGLLQTIRRNAIDTDPLYCNFTSGSTGVPKGVLVCHRSVIDFITVFSETFGITDQDVLGNQAPLDFDVSVKDVFTGLLTGAEVVLIPRSYFTFLKKLLELLELRGVTTLTWAVSALCLVSTMDGLSALRPARLKRFMFSGEVMPPDHLRYWRRHYPDGLFVNLYGPTEITCNCTYHIVPRDADPGAALPIGIPFPNERVFLLDEQNAQVTKPDTEGELCVSGTAVTLGYYNNPQRTAEAFVQNPLNTAYPEIIYRTGDLARYGADGLLYFAGRRDFQVKHHGRRVELGEIEIALAAAGAKRACALYMDKEERIVAYVIADTPPEALMRALRQALPDYMIPSEIIPALTLPLNSNGKLDRKALTEAWRSRKADV